MEVLASIRVSALYKGNTPWRLGQVRVFCENSKWKIAVKFACHKKDYLVLAVKKDSIDTVHWKGGQFWLEFAAGNVIRFKDVESGSPAKMVELLKGINKNQTNFLAPTPTKAPVLPVHAVVPNSPKRAPQRVPLSPKQQYTRAVDLTRQNPEQAVPPNHKSPRRDMRHLLETSQEKSAETLRNFKTASFYGNQNIYRSCGQIVSETVKRPGPQLLPNPERRAEKSTDHKVRYQWGKSPGPTPNTTLQGFSNLGNTCYMNAILQSLFNLLTFSNDVLRVACMLHKSQDKPPPPGFLSVCLSKLVSAQRSRSTVERQRMCLSLIKNAISASAKRFSGNNQHDAHEFLCQVLDQLKEEVISLNKQSTESSESTESPTSSPILDRTPEAFRKRLFPNPTAQNFEFEVLHTITCLECGEECRKAEVFHDLSLDMPRRRKCRSEVSLQDALDSFFRPETIEYTCAKCGSSEAHVSHTFTRLPRILILHLKRYNHRSGSSFHAKSGSSISLPRFLSLQHHSTELTTPPPPPPLIPIRSSTPWGRKRASTGSQGLEFSDRNTSARRSLQYQVKGSVQFTPYNSHNGNMIRTKRRQSRSKSCDRYIIDTSKDEEDYAQGVEPSLTTVKRYRSFTTNESDDEELKSVLKLSVWETTNRPNQEEIPQYDGTADDKEHSEITADDGAAIQSEENYNLQRALELSLQEARASKSSSHDDEKLSQPSITFSQGVLSQEFSQHSVEDDELADIPLSQGFPVEDGDGLGLVFDTDEPLLPRKRKYQQMVSDTEDKDEIVTTSASALADAKTRKRVDISCNENSTSPVTNSGPASGDNVQVNGHKDPSEDTPRSRSGPIYPLFTPRRKPKTPLKKRKSTETIESTAFDVFDEEPKLSSREEFEMAQVVDLTEEANKPKDEAASVTEGCRRPTLEGADITEGKGEVMEVDLRTSSSDDDKENKIPPEPVERVRVDKEVDFIDKRQQDLEKEEAEFQRALEMSLLEEEEREQREQEEIRQATELSLKDANSFLCNMYEDSHDEATPTGAEATPTWTKEEQEIMQRNSRSGELPYSYRLTSVVSHLGASSVAGHYVTDALDIQQSQWFCYNDSQVSKTTELSVCTSRDCTGYIFFYMSKEVLEELEEFYQKENADKSEQIGYSPARPLSV